MLPDALGLDVRSLVPPDGTPSDLVVALEAALADAAAALDAEDPDRIAAAAARMSDLATMAARRAATLSAEVERLHEVLRVEIEAASALPPDAVAGPELAATIAAAHELFARFEGLPRETARLGAATARARRAIAGATLRHARRSAGTRRRPVPAERTRRAGLRRSPLTRRSRAPDESDPSPLRDVDRPAAGLVGVDSYRALALILDRGGRRQGVDLPWGGVGAVTGVDVDDRLFRGIEQARRAIGRAEVALDAALRALLAGDRDLAVVRMADAALLTRSAADTLGMSAAPPVDAEAPA